MEGASEEDAEAFEEIYAELTYYDQDIEEHFEQYIVSKKVVAEAKEDIEHEQFSKLVQKDLFLLITSKMIRNEYIYYMMYKRKQEYDSSLVY